MSKDATGAQRICKALRSNGIEHVFGLPGTQNIALFEALRGSSLRTVVATNELSAAMMANGYYTAHPGGSRRWRRSPAPVSPGR